MTDVEVSGTGLPRAWPSMLGSWPDYSDPKEVLFSSELSIHEKREILSSWASDARAISGRPAQRRLDNGATVSIQDILDALKKLDAASADVSVPEQKQRTTHRRRRPSDKWLPTTFRSRSRDDDDDPPPCPAVVSPFPHLPPFGAESELEAA